MYFSKEAVYQCATNIRHTTFFVLNSSNSRYITRPWFVQYCRRDDNSLLFVNFWGRRLVIREHFGAVVDPMLADESGKDHIAVFFSFAKEYDFEEHPA